MIRRSPLSKPAPLNVVGSSTFGKYPKISIEKTYNMFESDGWLVPYPGYQAVPDSAGNKVNLGKVGRGIFTSTILNKIIAVVDNKVYEIELVFTPSNNRYFYSSITAGTMLTSSGDVYIAENNGGQIAISDGSAIYIYNPGASSFTTFDTTALGFVPGFITFHDTYFIAASLGTNQWRLSAQNDGTSWPPSQTGELQTKPDNVVGVTRFPSRGNMIFVFGSNVTESWFDVGNQLFPYQRNSNMNIDYGCVSASTIASTNQFVVWLAQNEKSGPVIMLSDGGSHEKITTDGIDFFMSNLARPDDSEAFIFRHDGHVFYNINFYSDNVTLFCDLDTRKFYHASDSNYNYFIAREVAFLNNQYYFVSKNDGHLYALDTTYTTYDGALIPRIRTCRSVRMPNQDYFIVTDAGFTIEQGVMPAQRQDMGVIFLITEDNEYIITDGSYIFIETEDGNLLSAEDGNNLIFQELAEGEYFLVDENDDFEYVQPRVDMCFSIDGGESFGNYVGYDMNPSGKSRNMLRWWSLGLANDFVAQFRFWGMGRFVATDGILNVRQ